jgi:glucose-6-phosphate 1-dehydrogenase
MSGAESDVLVLFGITGDLAYKKIFPALYAMVLKGKLNVPLIGVAREGWDLDRLKARARESVEHHGGSDPAALAKLCSLLRFVDGDYSDPQTFSQLRERLDSAQRPLHYLAIPPSMFAAVAEGLAAAGCARNARVVVEKPFGRSLASARELSATLHRFFAEEAIFRIDHFLGKEPVQNLIYFRFANPLIEAGWCSEHVESVQITMAEDFGVAGRGKFYEEAGAIRDVVQNHLLQVVACLGMECPQGTGHDAARDQRSRLLRAVRTLDPASVVRGQFRGYCQEPGVAPDSKVETFAAMRFHIDNDRWCGVPFYVRTGKCLPVTVTEVLVRFQRMRRPVVAGAESAEATYCRFRLDPQVVIALGAKVKKAGEAMLGEPIELVARHQSPDEMEPYERLLSDAARGDPTLFARQDAVEESWRIVDPVLGCCATPLYEYDPGTWGPTEAAAIVPGGAWHNPQAAAVTGCPC